MWKNPNIFKNYITVSKKLSNSHQLEQDSASQHWDWGWVGILKERGWLRCGNAHGNLEVSSQHQGKHSSILIYIWLFLSMFPGLVGSSGEGPMRPVGGELLQWPNASSPLPLPGPHWREDRPLYCSMDCGCRLGQRQRQALTEAPENTVLVEKVSVSSSLKPWLKKGASRPVTWNIKKQPPESQARQGPGPMRAYPKNKGIPLSDSQPS